MRQKIAPMNKAIQRTTEEILQESSSMQPSEIGSSIKQGIRGIIETRLDPAKKLYNIFEESGQVIPVPQGSLTRVANNINNIFITKI